MDKELDKVHHSPSFCPIKPGSWMVLEPRHYRSCPAAGCQKESLINAFESSAIRSDGSEFKSYKPNVNIARWTLGDRALGQLSSESNRKAKRLDEIRGRMLAAVEAPRVTKLQWREHGDDTSQLQDLMVNEVMAMNDEIDGLRKKEVALKSALCDVRDGLRTSADCRSQRSQRRDRELVDDEVNKELEKEIYTIQRYHLTMTSLLEQVRAQIEDNLMAKSACDLELRQGACELSNSCTDLTQGTQHGRNEGFTTAGLRNSGKMSVSGTRFLASKALANSKRARAASKRRRHDVDELLRRCSNELRSHSDAVNDALRRRIEDGTESKNRLQSHLLMTMEQIKKLESEDRSQEAVYRSKKTRPLRLDTRRLEEGKILVNQSTSTNLPSDLKLNSTSQKRKLVLTERALENLGKVKNFLELIILSKEHSLEIDSVKCINKRRARTSSASVTFADDRNSVIY